MMEAINQGFVNTYPIAPIAKTVSAIQVMVTTAAITTVILKCGRLEDDGAEVRGRFEDPDDGVESL